MIGQAEIRERVESFEIKGESWFTEATHNTARALVEQSLKVQEGQGILIWYDPTGLALVKEMYQACVAKGARVTFFERHLEEDAQAIIGLSDDKIQDKFREEKALIDAADGVLLVRGPENPEAMKDVPKEQHESYEKHRAWAHKRRITDKKEGGVDWCLFLWPTEYEAKKEKLPHKEYMRFYFEACNQPWKAIKEAQAKLKKKLDPAKRLELIANELDEDPRKRTHLTMSIEGMTFCNSIIDKNYPGSELFSAPVLDSVNGHVYAEGEYLYDGFLMKNIFLRFENGKIVEAFAEEGNEGLQQILNQGVGARYLGEVALGTNPGLIRRFFNDLFNEKVGGSFHIALGHCYPYTEYDGEPVHINNGNTEDRTPNHWDLTILMHHDGKIILDGEVIQENGIFKNPELAILNPKLPRNPLVDDVD